MRLRAGEPVGESDTRVINKPSITEQFQLATELNLQIPPTLLSLADEVIE
jgi:hypothetical protein